VSVLGAADQRMTPPASVHRGRRRLAGAVASPPNLAGRTIETYVDSGPSSPRGWNPNSESLTSTLCPAATSRRRRRCGAGRCSSSSRGSKTRKELPGPNPMATMRPPIVPEKPVRSWRRRSSARCSPRRRAKHHRPPREGFLRLCVDTGLCLAELVGLAVDDVDLDDQVATVVGKGRRPRMVPFGAKTTAALDRYLRLPGATSQRRTQRCGSGATIARP
jgi:hypothetical protein